MLIEQDDGWALTGRWPPLALIAFIAGGAGFVFFGYYAARNDTVLGLSQNGTWLAAIACWASLSLIGAMVTWRARRRHMKRA